MSDREHMRRIGRQTQFSGERAATAARKSREKAKERAELKQSMTSLAALTLYNARVLPDDVRRATARRVGVPVDAVTPALACLVRQLDAALDGSLPALTFLRDTAGEKPTERTQVEVDTSAQEAEKAAFFREAFDKLTNEEFEQLYGLYSKMGLIDPNEPLYPL